MRIGIFGNTNNLHLELAMELRNMGNDVELIVNQLGMLHRPDGLFPKWRGRYPKWVHDISQIPEEDIVSISRHISPVLDILDRSDAMILNHLGPSFAGLLAERPYIAHMTGSDLEYFADHRTLETRAAVWSQAFKESGVGRLHTEIWRQCIERQREGIAHATSLAYFPRGAVPKGDTLLDELEVPDERRFSIYFGAKVTGTYQPPPERRTVVIFCGVRITWVRPGPPDASELDFKGTDKLLRGVAKFLGSGGARIELRLVEKGVDVVRTKQLIAELGLDDVVVWLKEMNRQQFRKQIDSADIVVDHFDSSFVGMAGLEAMAVGRPLLATSNKKYWMRQIGVTPPICDAATPEEICEQLDQLVPNRSLRNEVGEMSRQFVSRYWSVTAAASECVSRLEASPSRKASVVI